jgi:hypothetical protein
LEEGYGVQVNKELGRKKELNVLTCVDGYWTFVYSILLEGRGTFSSELNESNRLKQIWKS